MTARIGFGAAYYPEYQPTPRLGEDLRLMREAGFSVIRVGESTWSTWEPEDGRFETAWMREVLDAAAEHGIDVILGTPTYAAPPWLARAHPEIAAEAARGVRLGWGARQEIDITNPTFRRYAERVIRRIVTDLGDHPAVVGYQLDNEPGLLLLHNDAVFASFRTWLAERFDGVADLNDRWGLAYWSHRLSTWADLWRPDGNAQPQYALAWRLYQAEVVAGFIGWQAGIVRELARPEQWLTTCIAYDRPAADDLRIAAELDIASGNAYYRMQDGLRHPAPVRPQGWMTDGTWSVFLSADRMFGSRRAPFLVTETNAGAINVANVSEPGWDGQWRQAAWAMIGRGARLIEYWHWHTAHFGTETHWVGVLPHDQRPGRVYRNIAELGQEIRQLGERVAATTPDADVGLVFSTPSKYALAFEPVFGDERPAPASRSYQRLVEAFYRGAFDAGLQAHVLHDRALPSGAELAEQYRVLIVPGLYVSPDGVLATLRDYVAAGGHLVLGPRTGYADEWAVARRTPQPAGLADLAGASYQEFTTLTEPVPVTGPDGGRLGAAEGWAELLEADDAEVLARYDHRELGAFAAATTLARGAGRVTTVGFAPDPGAAVGLLRQAADRSGLTPFTSRAASVTHSSATGPQERVHFYFNWSGEAVTIDWPEGQSDRDGGRQGALALSGWDVRLLWEPLGGH
ncbi:beta-galactosidase [Occultella glacieicola]|uniref:beta-galactosidase n=1 Tax=Occultella glacieicola TaxID=2518684 RepID=A0ABY2E517_9MICO|nr:beta-galactosidase [Occultella glacieicola]TDE95118.1 beta-galactosidase [Occultella glacieicola]